MLNDHAPAFSKPGRIPAFAINLDRSPKRWKMISENCDAIGLSITRISAIDGLELPEDEETRLFGPGPVACARSHYKAMATFLETDAPAALILEDDAEIGESVPALIQSLDWWPAGYGFVKLDSTLKPGKKVLVGQSVGEVMGRKLHPLRYKHMGAYGYLVDRVTATECLAIAPNVPMPIDHLFFHLGNSRLARDTGTLQLVPGAVSHRPLGLSDIADTGAVTRQERRNEPWKDGLLIRAQRRFGGIKDTVTGRAIRVAVPFVS